MILKLCNDGKSVVGTREDGATVSYSIEAEEYKQWLLDGGVPLPEFTAAEIALNTLNTNWGLVNKYESTLEVTALSGHKYAVNEKARGYIREQIDTLPFDATMMWIEEWGTFPTTIVELKEVINEAARLIRVFTNTTFGV